MVDDNKRQVNGKQKKIKFDVDDDNNEYESKWLWPYPVTGESTIETISVFIARNYSDFNLNKHVFAVREAIQRNDKFVDVKIAPIEK